MRCGIHNHTTWVDGKNTAAEMAAAAYEKGLESFGFSEHAFSSIDLSCCMMPYEQPHYMEQIRQLKNDYSGKMNIFLGLEIEMMAPVSKNELDYCIGSVHLIEKDGAFFGMDNTSLVIKDAIACFGSMKAVIKEYFATCCRTAPIVKPDVFGHFDLYKKLNQGGQFFDESDSAYQNAALEAIDAVADTGVIIEVNTGGIGRGYIKEVYPAPFLLRRLKERNTPIIITSDAHRTTQIDFAYEETKALLKEIGFTEQMMLTENGFISVAL